MKATITTIAQALDYLFVNEHTIRTIDMRYNLTRQALKFVNKESLIEIRDKRISRWVAQSNITSREVNLTQLVGNIVEEYSGKGNYNKIAIIGNSNIYLASPVYGHSDYNKSILFPNTSYYQRVAALLNNMLNKRNG